MRLAYLLLFGTLSLSLIGCSSNNNSGSNDDQYPQGEYISDPNVKLERVYIDGLEDLNIYRYGSHYYSLCKTTMAWFAAEEYCETIGGHLLTIENKTEFNIFFTIGNIEKITLGNTYIGLIDRNMSGNWVWVDGSDYTYVNWHQGEPNYSNGAEYVGGYMKGSGGKWAWNDYNPSGSLQFMIEWDDYHDFNHLRGFYSYTAASTSRELLEAIEITGNKIYLINDIYMDDNFTGINTIDDTIDGNGYTIHTPSRVMDYENYVNFVNTNTGTIKNVKFDIDIYSSDQFNGIAGVVRDNRGTLENIEIIGSIYAPRVDYVSGLVYTRSGGTVKNIVNRADIVGHDYVGGIWSSNDYFHDHVSNFINYGDIAGNSFVGGLYGRFYYSTPTNGGVTTISMESFINHGEIRGNNYVGGLFGYYHCDRYAGNSYQSDGSAILDLKYSSNDGDITGNNYVGGLFGFAQSDNGNSAISNSYSKSLLTGITYFGCLVGYADYVKIIDCKNDGSEIFASNIGQDSSGNPISYAGGFAGFGFYFEGCVNTAEIYVQGNFAGGIAAYCTNSIIECSNMMDIIGRNYVGGLAGYCSYTTNIEKSTNSGTIKGEERVGGLVGHYYYSTATNGGNADINIQNSVNDGDVYGSNYVGGFVGFFHCDRYAGNSYQSDGTATLKFVRNTNAGNVFCSNEDGVYGAFFGRAETDTNKSYMTNCVNLIDGLQKYGSISNVKDMDLEA